MKLSTLNDGRPSLDDAPRIAARGGTTQIRRFDGLTQRTSDWDGLRKDDQLWFADGDCLVHFCNYGASRRNASLKISYETVTKLRCSYLSQQCLHVQPGSSSGGSQNGSASYNEPGSPTSSLASDDATHELYIPAPADATRSQSFSYHLTTRNLVAYAVGAPLVGEKLSIALTDLWNRLREWQLPNRLSGFTAYLEKQGYLNFTEYPEYALACLKFAEDAHLKDIWIDAFVHCAGMHERLGLSAELASISRTTAALITRASLEMDLHISRVIRAVGSFLEEELGPEYLGLSKPLRDHLDYFRSFLHSYYVDKLGYYPPSVTSSWNKRPWQVVYNDFRKLYDYLADPESSSDSSMKRGLTGGVCVVQNIQAFDTRHGYTPLRHSLPLYPQSLPKPATILSSQTALRNLRLGKVNSSPDLQSSPTQALATATNCSKADVMNCSLVQEYRRFERQRLHGKLDVTEGRKTRWLLVYGVLQMLTSIMRAPKEVRDAETASYPLCVLTVGCPEWADEESDITLEAVRLSSSTFAEDKVLVPEALYALEGDPASPSRISIHPDCECDSAEDYFASNTVSRQSSVMSMNNMPNTGVQLPRTGSLRSSMVALHRSMVGSIVKRNGNKRHSFPLEPRKMSSFCEAVPEYCDEKEVVVNDDCEYRPPTAIYEEATPRAEPTSPWQAFDFGLSTAQVEPTLEHSQLDHQPSLVRFVIDDDDVFAESPVDSDFSTISRNASGSSKSSYPADVDSPSTEYSSWYNGGSRRNSDSSTASTFQEPEQYHSPQRNLTYQASNSTLGTKKSYASVHAGCYRPSGMVNRPVSAFGTIQSFSTDSLVPTLAPIYDEEDTQTDNVEEEPMRGRVRVRDEDWLIDWNVPGGGASSYGIGY